MHGRLSTLSNFMKKALPESLTNFQNSEKEKNENRLRGATHVDGSLTSSKLDNMIRDSTIDQSMLQKT